MTDHYDTLGVPRDATADEIKAAARRAASEAHPDRDGGSDERMKAVNAARDVLLHPERRAQYDATGSDKAAPSLEDLARDALVQLFTAAIENSEAVLQDVTKMLTEHRRRLVDAKKATAARVARLSKRSGKVRAKKGDNLVQMLIDDQIRKGNAEIEQMDLGLKVNGRATEMLQNYEEDAPPPTSQFTASFDLGNGAASSWWR